MNPVNNTQPSTSVKCISEGNTLFPSGKMQNFITNYSNNVNNVRTNKPSMPIAWQDFEENYHKGDLIYGLMGPRTHCTSILRPCGMLKNSAYTIDAYIAAMENQICKPLRDHKYIKTFNRLNRNATEEKIDVIRQSLSRKYNSLVSFDKTVAQQYKINPYHHWKTFLSLERNTKFNTGNILAKSIYYTDCDSPLNDNFITEYLKTKCKSGLQMAMMDDKIKIHFLLDDISDTWVVYKYLESYTSSELRFAFRNRTALTGKIFFYNKGRQVAPPWEQNSTLWEEYHPKSSESNSSA